MIEKKLKELYPEFDCKNYTKDLSNHIIYKHDESGFAGAIAPYCCSITMYPFLNEGIKKIGGLSAYPKNLDSFCGMYINLIFATAAQFAGAVATSEFLLYFDYFAKKE
jgi:ribonucleoside-triphosphate reductase|nr:MAG TPA: anaerobic ribonucleoside triphosphate reductase [Caudoviricetes sp.]